MNYLSTRGGAPVLRFDDVLLAGLARDGGLYLPETWPRLSSADMAALAGFGYAEVAYRVMRPYVKGAIAEDDLARLVADAYAGFDDGVAPLVPLADGEWLLELFHGPTLAFKDYAMQVLGRLFDLVLGRRGERITVVGATSGDTGSAAIEACRDRESIEIFILHPKGRVSEVQRRQMTTVAAANVHNVAVEGTFDDCQDLVKALFNDSAFRARHRLSAVNSINWARIMAQIPYYVWAATRLGAPGCPVSFAVPTGNFGNVFAGDAARRMGVPVGRLVVASNRNDILTRFFSSGAMKIDTVVPTISPSMDIQVSSNFERLLFELLGRDGAAVARTMEAFRKEGRFAVDSAVLARARAVFDAGRADDAETAATIRTVHETTGRLIDPHTAVGVRVARACRGDSALVPGSSPGMVVLATAHPAKFPDAVEAATGVRPPLPPRLADLFRRPERCVTLPNDLGAVREHISARAAARGIAA